jgi:DNA replication protein DnaC
VVGEVRYLSVGRDAANVLFHVVNDRHVRRRSMLFTTNKPLKDWGAALHEPDLAQAILDRFLGRGRIVCPRARPCASDTWRVSTMSVEPRRRSC